MHKHTKRILYLMLFAVLVCSFAAACFAGEPVNLTPVAGSTSFENEGPENLWDLNPETKFCTDNSQAFSIAKTESGEAVTVTSISLTTAGDNMEYDGRLPADWAIYATNSEEILNASIAVWTEDGINFDAPSARGWTRIASGSDKTFIKLNNAEIVVGMNALIEAKYFCFVINGIAANLYDESIFQLSEIRMFTVGNEPSYVGQGPCGQDLTWTIWNDGELSITGTGEMQEFYAVSGWENEQGEIEEEYSFFETSPWVGYGSMINRIVIDDGVTYISSHAFAGPIYVDEEHECWVGEPAFPDPVLTLGTGIQVIGDTAFGSSGISSFDLPDGLNEICGSAFSFNPMKEMSIPASVELIGACAFEFCPNLETVTFGDGIQLAVVENYTFNECTALTSIDIPASVTEIHEGAFRNTGLTSVIIPANVERLCADAFVFCGDLVSLTFEAGSHLNVIENGVFSHTSITSVTIPASVTELWDLAFYNCRNLKTVTFEEASQLGWIGDSAFWCSGLTSVEIPASVTDIRAGAFSDCPDLTSVRFVADSRLETICDSAFHNSGLTSIDIPASVTEICIGAFSECRSLKAVNFAADGNLLKIGGGAFRWTGITSVVIPASVKTIGSEDGMDAFAYTYDLETITFAEGSQLTYLCRAAFYVPYLEANEEEGHGECIPKLSGELVLPDSIEYIGELAFVGNRFATVTIGPKVTDIGRDAFAVYSIEGEDGSLEKATFLGNAPVHVFGDGGVEPESDEQREDWMNSIFGGASESFVIEYPCGAEGWNEEVFTAYEKTSFHTPGKPMYAWEEAHTEIIASVTCSGCGEVMLSEKGWIKSDETLKPTCTETGTIKYTATFENDMFETQIDTVETPAFGHFLEHISAHAPTETDDGNIEYWRCRYRTCGLLFADENAEIEISPTDIVIPKDMPRIEISSVTDVLAGSEVTVTVSLHQNPGLLGAMFSISWDNLILKHIEKGNALDSLTFSPPDESANGSGYPNPSSFIWEGTSMDETNGTLLVLTFKVPVNADKETYSITIDPDDPNFQVYGLNSDNPQKVDLCVINGEIEIASVEYGDVNCDGMIDLLDVITLRRYIHPNYTVELPDLRTADVTGDGVINLLDVILLRKFIHPNYDVVLGPQ